jgi:hypothetical protein
LHFFFPTLFFPTLTNVTERALVVRAALSRRLVEVVVGALAEPRGVAVQLNLEKAKFVTGFSRWVKGQAQGLEPGAFKLWVNWI